MTATQPITKKAQAPTPGGDMKVVKVNKVTPVTQTDYLRILGEAMVQVDTPHVAEERKAVQHELHRLIYNRTQTTGANE